MKSKIEFSSDNYKASKTTLINAGFELVSTTLGQNSGSIWLNPKTKQVAEIRLTNNNKISYIDEVA
jgi:hypothetical protein